MIDRAVTLVWLLAIGVPATLYLQRVTGIDLERARELRAEGDADAGDGVATTTEPATEPGEA